MSDQYTILSYPNSGYKITEDGDIIRSDGMPFEGSVRRLVYYTD